MIYISFWTHHNGLFCTRKLLLKGGHCSFLATTNNEWMVTITRVKSQNDGNDQSSSKLERLREYCVNTSALNFQVCAFSNVRNQFYYYSQNGKQTDIDFNYIDSSGTLGQMFEKCTLSCYDKWLVFLGRGYPSQTYSKRVGISKSVGINLDFRPIFSIL